MTVLSFWWIVLFDNKNGFAYCFYVEFYWLDLNIATSAVFARICAIYFVPPLTFNWRDFVLEVSFTEAQSRTCFCFLWAPIGKREYEYY